MSRALLVSALLMLPGAAVAQAHPLIGNWTMSVPAGMRMQNGEATPIMAKGTMAVVAKGDSLIATLTTEAIEDRPARPPVRLAARQVPGKMTFVHTSDAHISMNGVESTHASTSTYTFEVSGDSLKGTVELTIEGMELAITGPQPLSGVRVKQ